jgi:hypothetical protein
MIDGKYSFEVITDSNGDQIVQLTDDFCQEVGWVAGDTIKWVDNSDGTWTLIKIDEPDQNNSY